MNVEIERTAGGVHLEFEVTADERMVVPPREPAQRRNGLWQTTCFEMFARTAGASAYTEYNFSPSTCWAAYAFAGYRDPIGDADVRPPEIGIKHEEGCMTVTVAAALPAALADAVLAIGLAAVIEDQDGRTSYWALRHGNAEKADFHREDCFVLTLPPPEDA